MYFCKNILLLKGKGDYWSSNKVDELEVVGSTPQSGDHFTNTIHLDQSMDAN